MHCKAELYREILCLPWIFLLPELQSNINSAIWHRDLRQQSWMHLQLLKYTLLCQSKSVCLSSLCQLTATFFGSCPTETIHCGWFTKGVKSVHFAWSNLQDNFYLAQQMRWRALTKMLNLVQWHCHPCLQPTLPPAKITHTLSRHPLSDQSHP